MPFDPKREFRVLKEFDPSKPFEKVGFNEHKTFKVIDKIPPKKIIKNSLSPLPNKVLPILTADEIMILVQDQIAKIPKVKPQKVIEKIIEKEVIKEEKKEEKNFADEKSVEELKKEVTDLKEMLNKFREILPMMGGSCVIGLPNPQKHEGQVLTVLKNQAEWQNLTSLSVILDKTTFLEVKFGNGNGSEQNFTLSAFSTVNFSGLSGYALDDIGGNYDPITNFYTVPKTGTYLIMTRLRVTDAQGLQENYGHGADIANQDSATFSWFETNTNRNGSLNQRISSFNKGDKIRMFVYSDTGVLPSSDGSMSIILFTS